MNYTRLSFKDRSYIEFAIKNSESISQISKSLSVNKTTIYRELKLNSDLFGYVAEYADEKHKLRLKWKYYFQLKQEIEKYSEFSKMFIQKYDKRVFGVDSTYHFIKTTTSIKTPSLRTVYNWINSNLWIISRNERLRHSYVKGGKRTASVTSRLVGARWVKPFWCRPHYINDRSDFGHWEIDLIVGKIAKDAKNNYNLITFNERKTRYGIIIKFLGKNPWNLSLVMWEKINELKLNVKSITSDNGFEFRALFYLGYRLKIPIYQADPYASFQRGSNENFNGFIRRYYKKRTNFNYIYTDELLEVQNRINNMPRKILDYKTSAELFNDFNYNKEPFIPKTGPFFLGRQKFKTGTTTKQNRFFRKFKT